MRFVSSALVISTQLIAVSAFAWGRTAPASVSQTFACHEIGQPAGMKISVTIDGNNASYTIPGQEADLGTLVSYSGVMGLDENFGGFPDWVAQVGGSQGSGVMYVESKLLTSGQGSLALYRAYIHSATDAGNQSTWFDCTK